MTEHQYIVIGQMCVQYGHIMGVRKLTEYEMQLYESSAVLLHTYNTLLEKQYAAQMMTAQQKEEA